MNASRAEPANRFSPDASVAPRRIVHHVQGRQHGPIKRLAPPGINYLHVKLKDGQHASRSFR